jgi:hypothetical protein
MASHRLMNTRLDAATAETRLMIGRWGILQRVEALLGSRQLWFSCGLSGDLLNASFPTE